MGERRGGNRTREKREPYLAQLSMTRGKEVVNARWKVRSCWPC